MQNGYINWLVYGDQFTEYSMFMVYLITAIFFNYILHYLVHDFHLVNACGMFVRTLYLQGQQESGDILRLYSNSVPSRTLWHQPLPEFALPFPSKTLCTINENSCVSKLEAQ